MEIKLHWNKSVAAKSCLVWYLLLQKIDWNKSATATVSLENLVRNVLKENKFRKKTYKSAVW